MRIQHNIMAMNAYRNYNTNTSALAKNLEKLSSGYKINRAGDDAAGLAISEKMRAQITGLNAAQKNVKDGISLVKTAEGAMQEIQDMLNRMDYLATQSANGTYDDPVDRLNLQKEVKALKSEINRIADSANFNGIKLLDGSLGEGSSTTKVEGLEDVSFTKKTDSQLAGPAAQKGSWEIDLSQFKFTSKDAAKDAEFKIQVGGTDIATVKLGGATGTALGVGDKDFKVTVETGDIGLGGTAKVTVNVKYDKESGKLTVTMKDTPTTTGQVATGVPAADDLKVTVAAGGSGDLDKIEINVNSVDGTGTSSVTLADNTGDVKVSDILALKTVQEARGPGDERLYGSATFSLSGLIEDGTTLKIGDQSFTFAVGGASKFKGGANVIDLTDIEADKMTDTGNPEKIAQRITSAFRDNKQFNVTFDNNGAGFSFTVKEKEGSGLDYLGSAIVGEKSGKDEAGDATWEGMVMIGTGTISNTSSGGLRLQIGDTADQFNQLSVIVGDMHVNAMGKGKTTLDGKEIEVTKTIEDVDISNQDGAAEAIGIIKNAINYVSGIRGDLGAVQNRLDHTAKNLSVMAENIQDAESTIRDTDVAEEMMAYTKNNILIQSAQAMLAQANAVPQGVLQLLG